MFKLARKEAFYALKSKTLLRAFSGTTLSGEELPKQADVVIIGGGVTGCAIAYHLSKLGIKAILLEKGRLTCGTTWHTAGTLWRLRPSDVDIKLLNATRQTLLDLEQETGIFPGWTENGGLFIARSEERLKEYKRLNTLGHFFSIENQILSSNEASKMFPILNPKAFVGALYSPGDGSIDPSMYCNALIKGAKSRGVEVFENCTVTNILADHPGFGPKNIKAVETSKGLIKTNCVVNAAGAWARNIGSKVGVEVPVTILKHAYIVTEPISNIKGFPNIRDHDGSIYYRMQGDSIILGGYETNPEIVKEEVPNEFEFGLYELNHSIFQSHVGNATELTPVLATVGVKSNVCGPEAFTPDHSPVIGEDPKVYGLFHACGFNSLGMMLSSGVAEQLALWISQGRPELPMFNYDIRRFLPAIREHRSVITEKTLESYVRNYDIAYKYGQPMAGRNFKTDLFHEVLVANGAVMEYAQGWERPAYFIRDNTAPVRGFDWYGHYDHVKNTDLRYTKQVNEDLTFSFSKHHDLVGEEALAARNNVALFDLSSYYKMYLTGSDAQEAADWLFTANVDRVPNRLVYTCCLNSKGGIEADVRVIKLQQGLGTLVGPILKGTGFYISTEGSSGYHTMCHLKKELRKKRFKSVITDITEQLGILSLQGPKSSELLQSVTEYPITDEKLPAGMSQIITIDGHKVRAIRVSFIGELGYELHIPTASCLAIYNKIAEAGRGFDMKLAGFRAMYSLGCEKGHHLWNYDIRPDDNPCEANLEFVCRKEGSYLGKQHVDKYKKGEVRKQRVFLTLQDRIPLHGLETIWRDDSIVGFLRRAEYGYSLDCSIGVGYVHHPNDKDITENFLKSGVYEIEVMGKKYPATLFTRSPFDPTNQRLFGKYEHAFQEQSNFGD